MFFVILVAVAADAHVDGGGQQVIGDAAQPCVEADDADEVLQVVLHLALLVDLQAVLPIWIIQGLLHAGGLVFRRIREVLLRLLLALLRQLAFCGLVARGVFLHGLHAGVLVRDGFAG